MDEKCECLKHQYLLQRLAMFLTLSLSDEFYKFTAEDYYRLLGTKKQVETKKLRDAEEAARRSQDFYSAGFVPGAIVYFAYDMPKDDNNGDLFSGPFLQEEVMSLQRLEFLAQHTEPASEPTPEPVVTGPSTVPERKPANKKNIKPKWLKM